jgi:hypothetical protein
VSSDRFTDAGAQHHTQVEPDSFSYRGKVVSVFQSGRAFGGGASDVGWATSDHAGRASGFLPGITKPAGGPFDRVSDASVAYDVAHHEWLISSLALDATPTGVAVVVSRSHDGLHWGPPVTVAGAGSGQDLDKNWTVCDNSRSSPFFGRCYTEFDDFGHVNLELMSTSRDGGLTWSAPVATAAHDLGIGGQPVVQPNGNVIVPLNDLVQQHIRAFRSTDGGASWSAAVTVASIPIHPVAGGLRTSPLPSAEIDGAGRVFVAWQDCRFRPGCSSNDIVLSSSADGITWSAVSRVPIDPVTSRADHFIPGLAVDRSSSGPSARLALTYYYYPSADCTPATCELDVGLIRSSTAGASWSAPIQLAGPMHLSWLANTSQGVMVGDYISTSFVGGKVRPFVAVAKPPSGGVFHEAIYTTAPGTAQAAGGARPSEPSPSTGSRLVPKNRSAARVPAR